MSFFELPDAISGDDESVGAMAVSTTGTEKVADDVLALRATYQC